MKYLSKLTAAFACLSMLGLSACKDEKSNYPDTYIGFEKPSINLTVDKQTVEQDITVKIISIQKKEADTKISINGQWQPEAEMPCQVLDPKVVIPAKKKSVTVRIRIFPSRIKDKKTIRIACVPHDKEATQSQLSIRVTVK